MEVEKGVVVEGGINCELWVVSGDYGMVMFENGVRVGDDLVLIGDGVVSQDQKVARRVRAKSVRVFLEKVMPRGIVHLLSPLRVSPRSELGRRI